MKTFEDGIKKGIEICDSFKLDGYYDDYPSGQRNAIEKIKSELKKELQKAKDKIKRKG